APRSRSQPASANQHRPLRRGFEVSFPSFSSHAWQSPLFKDFMSCQIVRKLRASHSRERVEVIPQAVGGDPACPKYLDTQMLGNVSQLAPQGDRITPTQSALLPILSLVFLPCSRPVKTIA